MGRRRPPHPRRPPCRTPRPGSTGTTSTSIAASTPGAYRWSSRPVNITSGSSIRVVAILERGRGRSSAAIAQPVDARRRRGRATRSRARRAIRGRSRTRRSARLGSAAATRARRAAARRPSAGSACPGSRRSATRPGEPRSPPAAPGPGPPGRSSRRARRSPPRPWRAARADLRVEEAGRPRTVAGSHSSRPRGLGQRGPARGRGRNALESTPGETTREAPRDLRHQSSHRSRTSRLPPTTDGPTQALAGELAGTDPVRGRRTRGRCRGPSRRTARARARPAITGPEPRDRRPRSRCRATRRRRGAPRRSLQVRLELVVGEVDEPAHVLETLVPIEHEDRQQSPIRGRRSTHRPAARAPSLTSGRTVRRRRASPTHRSTGTARGAAPGTRPPRRVRSRGGPRRPWRCRRSTRSPRGAIHAR